jgi:hypothetical protein
LWKRKRFVQPRDHFISRVFRRRQSGEALRRSARTGTAKVTEIRHPGKATRRAAGMRGGRIGSEKCAINASRARCTCLIGRRRAQHGDGRLTCAIVIKRLARFGCSHRPTLSI